MEVQVMTVPIPVRPRNSWLTTALAIVGALFLIIVVWGIFFRDTGLTAKDVQKIVDKNTPVTAPATTLAPPTTTVTTLPETSTTVASTPAGDPADSTTPPVNAEGFQGPTTATAKDVIKLNVQRLKTEASAFVWRSVPNVVSATCPSGWVCTLDTGKGILVVAGDDKSYPVQAGTFRFIAGYPAGDAVYEAPPCTLLNKEIEFGKGEVPSFPVSAGNFSCGGTNPAPAAAAPAAPAAPAATQCPKSPDEVATSLGGSAGLWTPLEDGWKYNLKKVATSKVSLKHPGYGRIDYDGGSLSSSGSTPSGVVFTFWCKG